MTDASAHSVTAATLRLMAWLSPAFPTGAFAYSSGLEQAAEDGLVSDRATLDDWLRFSMAKGFAWSDAVLLAETLKNAGDAEQVSGLAELGSALCSSKERYLETTAQGEAFLKAAQAWQAGGDASGKPVFPASCPLPVAVGIAAAGDPVLGGRQAHVQVVSAFLHAAVSNQIQAALRLLPLGQQNGVELLAALEAVIPATAERALEAGIEGLGTAAVSPELAAMRHEALPSRIFRS